MKKNPDKWSESELNVIKDSGLSHNEAAFRIGRSYAAVKAKRRLLSVVVSKKDIDYYTPEALKVLVENRHLSNPELAKLMGRSVQGIALKRQRLGIGPPSNEWEADEIEYLATFYYSKSKKEIATHLGRSVSAVTTKAGELGITRQTEYWTSAEIGVLLNNLDKSNKELTRLVNKSESQIAYKKAYINYSRKKERKQIEGIESGVPMVYKSKQAQYLEMLMALEIEQSFLFPAKEMQHLSLAKAYIPDRIFKSKKVDEHSRRVWRLA